LEAIKISNHFTPTEYQDLIRTALAGIFVNRPELGVNEYKKICDGIGDRINSIKKALFDNPEGISLEQYKLFGRLICREFPYTLSVDYCAPNYFNTLMALTKEIRGADSARIASALRNYFSVCRRLIHRWTDLIAHFPSPLLLCRSFEQRKHAVLRGLQNDNTKDQIRSYVRAIESLDKELSEAPQLWLSAAALRSFLPGCFALDIDGFEMFNIRLKASLQFCEEAMMMCSIFLAIEKISEFLEVTVNDDNLFRTESASVLLDISKTSEIYTNFMYSCADEILRQEFLQNIFRVKDRLKTLEQRIRIRVSQQPTGNFNNHIPERLPEISKYYSVNEFPVCMLCQEPASLAVAPCSNSECACSTALRKVLYHYHCYREYLWAQQVDSQNQHVYTYPRDVKCTICRTESTYETTSMQLLCFVPDSSKKRTQEDGGTAKRMRLYLDPNDC
jgi:hypothetical protein